MTFPVYSRTEVRKLVPLTYGICNNAIEMLWVATGSWNSRQCPALQSRPVQVSKGLNAPPCLHP